MGHHAMVGTHRVALDMPAPMQHLDGVVQAERRVFQGPAQPLDLHDARRVGQQDAAGAQRRRGVGNHPPRLRQIEHHPVEAGLVDALVDVPNLGAVPLQRLGAAEALDVGPGPGTEVLPPLVARHDRARPQQRHRQRSRADPGFEHPGARKDVGQDEDRPRVLGIHHLRSPGHLEHGVGQGGAHGQEGRAARGLQPGALGRADDVVMGDHTGVGVELAARGQVDQVAAVLAVDQQDRLARLERPGGHRRPRSEKRTGAGEVARSVRRQKAHTPASVGDPHRSHAARAARSRSTSARNRSEALSRKPK